MFSWCCWTLLLPTSSWQWTNLTPLTSNELVLDYTKGCRDWQSHSAMERATERMSATRMHICEVYNKSFTRKDNLSQHLSVHGKKRFQCNHCSKCYSRWKKLKVHIFRHHTNDKQKFSNKSLSCGHCSKVFGWSFNLRRHIAVCKKKSVEATKSDMEAMIIEMTSAEREYRQKLEVGETVSTLLHANELLSEESLMDKYKKALRWKLWSCIDSRKFSMCQYMNMPHWSHGKRKYWHSFNNLPIGRLFGSLVNREGKARLSFKTISSITTVTTGRGTSAETCGLDDVFPPDDLGSRPEALC